MRDENKRVPLRVDLVHSLPYMSNNTFRAFAQHIYDLTSKNLNPNDVKQGDVVFLKTDLMGEYFAHINPFINVQYILITHDSDYSAPGCFISELDKHPNIIMWFCQNYDSVAIGHPRMRPLPIGLAGMECTHGNINNFLEVLDESDEMRTIDLYVNFTIYSNYNVRARAFQAIQQLQSKSPEFNIEISNGSMPHKEYVRKLSQSRFVASPEGNGIDCYRTWESAMMKAIPIITRSSLTASGLFTDMPVMIIESWESLTIESMNDFYMQHKNELQNLQIKSLGEYWLNEIDLVRKSIIEPS